MTNALLIQKSIAAPFPFAFQISHSESNVRRDPYFITLNTQTNRTSTPEDAMAAP